VNGRENWWYPFINIIESYHRSFLPFWIKLKMIQPATCGHTDPVGRGEFLSEVETKKMRYPSIPLSISFLIRGTI